jgi:hypothetical protein
MRRKVVLAVALVLCLASHAQAALFIVVPTITVQDPGLSQRTFMIDILVTGDGGADQAASADLHAQIGPNLPGPNPPNGNPASPTIAAVISKNTFTGSFFNNAANGVSLAPAPSTSWSVNEAIFTNLNSDSQVQTVAAAGLFVTLKIDYTGFHAGSWPIILSASGAEGATDILDANTDSFPLVITDGSFTITAAPEPTSLVLGLLAAAGLGIVAIRKRRPFHASCSVKLGF